MKNEASKDHDEPQKIQEQTEQNPKFNEIIDKFEKELVDKLLSKQNVKYETDQEYKAQGDQVLSIGEDEI
jgi:hypothetical protein